MAAVGTHINGKLIVALCGFTTGYEAYRIDATSLKSGTNVVAIHCHQSTGGQFTDFGFYSVVPKLRKALSRKCHLC